MLRIVFLGSYLSRWLACRLQITIRVSDRGTAATTAELTQKILIFVELLWIDVLVIVKCSLQFILSLEYFLF